MLVKDNKLQTYRYWDIQIPSDKVRISNDLITKCRNLILDSASLRLRSDVQTGGTLSGGLDSSTLTCLIDQNLVNDKYPVFTVQFPGYKNDESRFVNEVVSKSEHLQLFNYLPTHDELINDLPKIIWYQDEPFGDSSIFAHYLLMKVVKEKGVKVVLTGQGADEVFGGYLSYYRAFLGSLLLQGQILSLSNEIKTRARVTNESQFQLYTGAVYHALPLYLKNKLQTLCLDWQSDWISRDLRRSVSRNFHKEATIQCSYFDWYLYQAIYKWSLPHLLHYDDRNSMAYGIESRAPYLDYRLIELLFSTCDEAKISNGQTKTLLRSVSKGIVPNSITSRIEKIGFFTPMDDWLAKSGDFIYDNLNSNFAKQNSYFSSTKLLKLVQRLINGEQKFMSQVWRGLSLSVWHETIVKNHNNKGLI